MIGGEAGMSFQTLAERLTVRSNFFWNVIDDPVANVTLSTSPILITRQRQNLGSLRARGSQLDAELKLNKRWQLSAGYLFTDSTVTQFPANVRLEGLRIPQIPKHQINFQVNYLNAKWTFGVQARFVGTQFDDDLNTLPLDQFFTADAVVSRSLSSRLTIFVALQNLTSTRYEIGRSPVLTVGPPRLVRVGVRVGLR
jgi:outer membrane receptor protein involved in Fe transport